MKLITKISNLKLKTKIIIITLTTLLIAAFNFVYYNYKILKLPEDKRNYSINLEEAVIEGFEKKENSIYSNSTQSKIILNLENIYVDEILVKYKTEKDFEIKYNGEYANYYGVYKQKGQSDTCYSIFDTCGISPNTKLGNLELSINSSDVEITEIVINNQIYFNFTTFIFWALLINLILVIVFGMNYFTKNKHTLALILCLSIGFMFLVSEHNMTTTTLDDDTHFKMANLLSHSNDKISVSDYYLQNYIVTFHKLDTKTEKNNYQEFINQNNDNHISYTFNESLLKTNKINYLPMALTLKASTLFGANKTTSFLIARVVQLLIYSFGIALAVKIIPTHKMLLLVIGLFPQTLYLATNFSYDPTVTMFILLSFSAFVSEYHNSDKKLKLSNVLIFILAGIYGIFPKAIYSPFLLLMLLLPKTKFNNEKQYKRFKMLIIIIFLICMSSFIIPLLTDPSTRSDARGGDTSAIRQIEMILKAPLSFIRTFWESAILKIPVNLFGPSTFGLLSYYGGMGIDISYYLFIVAMVISFFNDGKNKKIKKFDRLFMLIIYAFIICVIFGSMYLVFTPVGESVINGVQARYFIPLIFPILYSLSSIKIKSEIKPNIITLVCSISCLLANFYLIYYIIICNYCI